MSNPDPTNIYNAYYFAHGCGRPYERDDYWLAFFDGIAARIAEDIAPETVLDAGCAMGFLVETLRNHEVKAFGIDISDFAISKVHPDIYEYCWVGSITEPFPQKYDLITTIEVLEHLQRAESEKALANLCAHTDDIIFSSTPLDFKEATHFNVQPPEYWAELFARQGFYRDVDFDASFITPWAARFRRTKEPLPRVVKNYERKFSILWKENTDLRSLVGEMRGQLVDDENTLRAQSASHDHALLEKDKHILNLKRQIQDYENFWAETQQSTGWQILHRYRVWQGKLAPPGSRTARLIRSTLAGLRMLKRDGPIAFFRKVLKRGLSGSGAIAMSSKAVERANASAYETWIETHTLPEHALAEQRKDARGLHYRPLISIVTPVYNPPPQVLRETIESVLAQTYDNWELCLVDGASDAPEVRAVLDSYDKADPRIRVALLDQNEGISGNTNKAIAMAKGEFIAILDHDDVYAPNALYEIVIRLGSERDTDVIYFDEDKLSEDGTQRKDPFFKPDWSPEMLISANYLTHAVYRRSLVESVGRMDPETDGAQDWDLAFKVTEKTDRIEHIPLVLYHWRQIQGSTAGEFNAKHWAFDSQVKSIRGHLARTGITDAEITFPHPGLPRVTWPTRNPKVSIIIPTKDKVYYLRKCLTSVMRLTHYENCEIILVDTGSQKKETEKYYEKLREDPKIKFVEYSGSFNYSSANNLGAEHATGEILLFLNNDIEALTPDWLEEMVRWAERPDVGVVGAKLLYPDMTIQHAGVVIGMEGHASHVFWSAEERQGGPFGSVDWYRNYSAITGACLMMPRRVFEAIGRFDEKYILAFSDIELCMRALKFGYRIVYTPFARLKHYEGKSRGDHIPANDVQVGIEHFLTYVEMGDPYYNPNLSYSTRMPVVAQPGEENRTERLIRLDKLYRTQNRE